MLRPAYLHRDAVLPAHAEFMAGPRARWYNLSGYQRFDLDVESDDWSRIQRVSLGPVREDGGREVLGWLEASVSRTQGKVTEIAAARYGEAPSATWARDLGRFFDGLYSGGDFRKIRWSCVSRNPSLAMYRKLCDRLGGREVGVREAEFVLSGGLVADQHLFEIHCP